MTDILHKFDIYGQALDHGIKLKKGYWVIKFNQKDWFNQILNWTLKIKKREKMILEKTFSSFTIHYFVKPWKMCENIKKLSLRQIIKEEFFRSELNYHSTTWLLKK